MAQRKLQDRKDLHLVRKMRREDTSLRTLLDQKAANLSQAELKLASIEEFISDWTADRTHRAVGSLREMLQEYLQYYDLSNTLDCFQAEVLAKKFDEEAETVTTLSASESEGVSICNRDLEESFCSLYSQSRNDRIPSNLGLSFSAHDYFVEC